MKNKGRVVIISGPSGVGKGSVNEELLRDKNLRLEYSVSMTTRKPRKDEVNGINYYFVSREEFANAIVNNQLIEHANFVGNLYGTPRKYVQDQLNKGKNVILEIEVDGATQVIRNEKNVLSIFLMPPTLNELASRIRRRATESEDKIKARLDKSLLEIPLKHNYDYIVENDSVINAVAKIADILKLENCTAYQEKSKFNDLAIIVKKIVDEKYAYFVNNWQENVKLLAYNSQEIFEAEHFDAQSQLVNILTNKVYRKVLAHGNFSQIDNKEFVDFKIQKLMFKINFFSIKQKIDLI